MKSISIVKYALIMALAVAALQAPAQSISAGGCTMSQSVFRFPFSGEFQFFSLQCPETQWFVLARNSDRGLQIEGASFIREGVAIPVLGTANVADNITLYHNGAHLNDMKFSNAANAIPTLHANELGPNGMLVQFTDEATPRAAMELRSRGLAWLCTWDLGKNGKAIARHGMEMTIWGIFDTGNYDYIIEYSFRDDGQIGFRAGATGWNNDSDATPDTAHTHDLLWRIDLHLGSGLNTPYVKSHYETSLFASDTETLFNNGFEGAADLDPLKYQSVLIEDQRTNSLGRHLGYELQPLRFGTGRHYGDDEKWSLHDTWITRFSQAELADTFSVNPWKPPNVYLLGDAANEFGIHNHQPITGQDIVLWQTTSAHHDPHDEDQAAGDNGYHGITLMHWMGFDLVPHNLSSANPLGGPSRDSCN